jgi:hypothetical protein
MKWQIRSEMANSPYNYNYNINKFAWTGCKNYWILVKIAGF